MTVQQYFVFQLISASPLTVPLQMIVKKNAVLWKCNAAVHDIGMHKKDGKRTIIAFASQLSTLNWHAVKNLMKISSSTNLWESEVDQQIFSHC